MKTLFISICLIISLSTVAISQSTIPKEYRGDLSFTARGVLDGNNVETNFRNHGEMARWGDIPWGSWGNFNYINGIGFIMAARVPGERAKWEDYYGVGISDTTLNPVIINYRDFGKRVSPYTGDLWGWNPLNGFHNIDESFPTPAISTNENSWPETWPDRLDQTDSGWPGAWSGYLGKGLVNGAQESFYVMDDHSDYEYAFGLETEGPHSNLGVYYPSPGDSTVGGLGLQTEVRTFQFDDPIAEDMLFVHYRTTNVSEKDLTETWTAFLVDFGLRYEESETVFEYNASKNYVLFHNSGEFGGGLSFLVLEHSLNETGGFKFDDDNDGILNESKFNGPGEYLEGKAAIDAYLNQNYNMSRFNQVHIDLEDFPAYRNERWWTGDEDLDWIAYDDLNQNGIQDDNEPLQDDVGRDGLGPLDESYPGPDEGEADGIPTQGEPNFGERDMLEAEKRGITLLDINTRPFYETGSNLRDDTWLFDRLMFASENISEYQEGSLSIDNDEPFMMLGVGPYELGQNQSSYVIISIVFGENLDEIHTKIDQAIAIYESDYGQSMFLTNNEVPDIEIPTQISLFQNYPNPFNPSTNIEFNLNKNETISLTVYDVMGRKVSTLVSGKNFSAGNHQLTFNASNLSSGIYFYQLEAGDIVQTKKMLLIK